MDRLGSAVSAAELAVGDQPYAPAEFPWVQVRHLASHVLGPLTRRGRRDWPARWGYAPLGLETCVAPDRFAGTCYRAAGGPALARTTGRGLARAGQSYPSTPKLIYVPGLAADFRPQLCGGPLARRVEL